MRMSAVLLPGLRWGGQKKPKDTIQNFQFCRVLLFTYSSNMFVM